jgi:hypothetical protein
MYKRVCLFVFAMTLVSGVLMAQTNTAVGTWKLNLAKSKFNPALSTPRSRTRTVETQGDDVKVSYEGVAGDGSNVAYNFTMKYDGKSYPISGEGSPNGSDTISVKRINPTTTLSTSKKADKVVQTTKTVVSKDGKVTTLTSKGTNEKGQPTSSKSVYDKVWRPDLGAPGRFGHRGQAIASRISSAGWHLQIDQSIRLEAAVLVCKIISKIVNRSLL